MLSIGIILLAVLGVLVFVPGKAKAVADSLPSPPGANGLGEHGTPPMASRWEKQLVGELLDHKRRNDAKTRLLDELQQISAGSSTPGASPDRGATISAPDLI